MNTALEYLTATAACILLVTGAAAQSAKDVRPTSPSAAISDDKASPIFGVTIPAGYRRWELIAPSHEAPFDELRGILGNAKSMKAYREGTLPFPDGAMLAKIAWKHVPSAEFAGAFVPGPATTVQIMVKDSKKYASTGGWGFGRFINGKPVDEAQHRTCFACHEANVKGHDFVFTRFAP
jgi:Cytochrome P460